MTVKQAIENKLEGWLNFFFLPQIKKLCDLVDNILPPFPLKKSYNIFCNNSCSFLPYNPKPTRSFIFSARQLSHQLLYKFLKKMEEECVMAWWSSSDHLCHFPLVSTFLFKYLISMLACTCLSINSTLKPPSHIHAKEKKTIKKSCVRKGNFFY